MKIKHLTILIALCAFLLASGTTVSAWQKRKPVTPYGDFCPRCGKYGTCKKTMSTKDAEKAMKDYYHKKRYNVEIENNRGRFIRAKIKDKGKVIDVIIFDRKTGRIRSIY
jgi:hypothetical protein